MDFITNVLCRLLLLTDSSTNFYVPASKNLRLLPSNVSSVSDFCLAPLRVKEDSNLAIDLPEDTDLLSQLNASETCKTPACIEAANILSNIDETVKPCDDFYQFACGGWMKRYVNDFMSLQELGYVSRKKMRVIFEKKLNGDQREFVRQMKVFYDTCMNQTNIPRAGVKLLKKVLKDLGGWPIIKGEKWNSSSFDWIDAVGRISQLKTNLYFLVTLSVVVDPRNNSFQIIKLSRIPRWEFQHILLSQGPDYYETIPSMIRYSRMLGLKKHISWKKFAEILDFEIRLINFTAGIPKEENDTYCTIHELKDKVPEINWMKLFKTIMNDEIHEDETVLVTDMDYISDVASFITNISKRELANYLIWKIIERFKNDFIDWSWEPRRQECFDFTYNNFQIILDSIYIQKHFPEDSRKAAIELTTYVENEYLNFLEKIDWMDEESKAFSMKKANARKLHYGYEKEILNDSFLSHFYTNLTFKDEDFICNILKLKKWLLNKPFSQRKSNPEHLKIKSSSFFKMIDSRASFDPTTNKIEITAAFFQNPLFNKDQPNYLNFGALGFIYGHEIIHGFNGESSGEMLDNFWSNETNDQFKIKTNCFLDQYAKYTIRNGMKPTVVSFIYDDSLILEADKNGIKFKIMTHVVDSNKTQNDNIADNIGYELAYLAYQSWLRDNGREPVLLGLKYTQNQLFWISAASNLCMKFSKVAEAQRLEMDYHSPAQFRVIGAISNVPEFARDFNCPPDSPMNPKNKCRVWRDN